MKIEQLLGLSLCSGTLAEVVEEIVDWCKTGTFYKKVFTVNTDHICKLNNNHILKQKYAKADWITPDGMPIVWASKVLDKPLPNRITGADLVPALLSAANDNQLTVAIIGTTSDLLDKFIAYCKVNYPMLEIVYSKAASNPFDPNGEEAKEMATEINKLSADIVIVGLGFPKQEQWLMNWDLTNCKVGVAVGASLEFLVGEKVRSPLWMQKAGLEWVGRMLNEPKRLVPRYASNFYFVVILIKELSHSKKSN